MLYICFSKPTMPKPKNLGPCVISDCNNPAPYRKLQTGTIEKIRSKDLENKYYFLEEGNQLCFKHYMKIVEPDRHDKDKQNRLKRKSGESLDADYLRNLQKKSNESSSNQLINTTNNQVDWSKIKIDVIGNNITMSKDDFLSIIEHINKVELQLDNNLYYVEDNEGDFDAINNEINDGNLKLV